MKRGQPCGFGARASRRPPQTQDTTPGLAARLAAAQAIADVLTSCAAARRAPAKFGSARCRRSMPRDRALARSIATVSLRRLGTIRKAFGRYPRQGPAAEVPGALEWILIVAAAQIAVSRRARSRRGRSRGARRAARSRRRAVRRRSSMRCCATSRAPRTEILASGRPARRRHAALARRALARHLRRSDGARDRPRPSRRADARPQRQERSRRLGAAARRRRAADRLGAARQPHAGRRT